MDLTSTEITADARKKSSFFIRSVPKIAILLMLAGICHALTGCSIDDRRNPLSRILFQGDISDREATPDFSSQQQPLMIWHDSFEDAKSEARHSGKLILADFTGSDWCGWCVKLKKDVFEKPEFASWAGENVVLLEIDFPKRAKQSAEIKKQNQQLAQRYDIESYPTVLLLDAEGNVQAKMGYQDSPSKWIQLCDNQLNKASESRFIADGRSADGSSGENPSGTLYR